MSAEQGFRSRQEIEAKYWTGRRRARRPMPHGKSLLVTGVVVLVLVSAGLLAVRSLFVNSDDEFSPKAQPKAKTFNSKDPFAGTPVARFAEGEAGIELPQTTQLGPWTAQQVKVVLARTKQTLVAGRLDPAMVEQGNPQRYLSTISPGARSTVQASFQSGEALGYVSRLATEYRLLAPIRVQGKMGVTLGPKKELVVSAKYVWVYPLTGSLVAGTPKGPGSKLLVLHTDETYQWFAPKGIAKKDTGLRPGAGQLATVNMDCDLARSGKLGLPRAPSGGAIVPDAKAYDSATRLEGLPNTC